MPYHFQKDESVPDGVRRIAGDELKSAATRLQEGQDQDEDIHEARKSVKKVRALLRLVRPQLGRTYQDESKVLRQVGRQLSELRDAGAVIEIFDKLKQKYPDEFQNGSFDLVRQALLEAKTRSENGKALRALLRRLAKPLNEMADRVKTWPVRVDGFPAMETGLRQTFRRGRKRLQRVQRQPRPETYHEWRKRIKDLWYHLNLLEGLWNGDTRRCEKKLKDLQNWLGDDHNLVILRQKLARDPKAYGGAKPVRALVRLIENYQKKLRSDADSLGKRVYDTKPRGFTRRIERLWKKWEAATPGSGKTPGHRPRTTRAARGKRSDPHAASSYTAPG